METRHQVHSTEDQKLHYIKCLFENTVTKSSCLLLYSASHHTDATSLTQRSDEKS
jgi:hypothetical protein